VIRITNAGEAKAKGVELELSAKPLDVLDVWASYGYLDSKYVALVDNTGVSRAGNRMQFAPENTYDVGVRLALPIRIGWKFTGQVDYRWQDEYYDDPSNLPVNTHGAYGLLDASLGLRTDDGHLAIELWGKNLTDELYATHNIPFLGDRFVVYGAPRTFGVRMRYEFQ